MVNIPQGCVYALGQRETTIGELSLKTKAKAGSTQPNLTKHVHKTARVKR